MNDDVFYAESAVRMYGVSKSPHERDRAVHAIIQVEDVEERKALMELLEQVEKEPSSYVGD